MRTLQFIDLLDDDGRTSCLSICSSRPGSLRVVGGLDHNADIWPKTRADAHMLVEWLLANMEKFPKGGSE